MQEKTFVNQESKRVFEPADNSTAHRKYYFLKSIGGYAFGAILVILIIVTLIYERSVGLFACPVIGTPGQNDYNKQNDYFPPPSPTSQGPDLSTSQTATVEPTQKPAFTTLGVTKAKATTAAINLKDYTTNAPPTNGTLLLIILLRLHFDNGLPPIYKNNKKGASFMFRTFLKSVGFREIQHISVRLSLYDSEFWIKSVIVLVYADWRSNLAVLQHYKIGHGSGSTYSFNVFPDCETQMLSYHFLQMTKYKGFLSTIKYPGDILKLRYTPTPSDYSVIQNLHSDLRVCVGDRIDFPHWKPQDCLRYYATTWKWICDGVNRTYEVAGILRL